MYREKFTGYGASQKQWDAVDADYKGGFAEETDQLFQRGQVN